MIKWLIPTVFILSACTNLHQTRRNETELKTIAILWQQQSAEYKALCYQAFNVAEWQIIRQLTENKSKQPKAIITDLDETLLDNSNCYGQALKEGKDPDWHRWKEKAQAAAIPGSLEFLRFAAEKGIEIFYVSNRDSSETANTIRNLKILSFPDADESHLLLMRNDPSKESRRLCISEKYVVLLLMGDNLQDFSQLFENKTIAERDATTDQLRKEWGKKFILLPNPIYGDWLNTLYNHNNNLSPIQKDSINFQLLKGY